MRLFREKKKGGEKNLPAQGIDCLWTAFSKFRGRMERSCTRWEFSVWGRGHPSVPLWWWWAGDLQEGPNCQSHVGWAMMEKAEISSYDTPRESHVAKNTLSIWSGPIAFSPPVRRQNPAWSWVLAATKAINAQVVWCVRDVSNPSFTIFAKMHHYSLQPQMLKIFWLNNILTLGWIDASSWMLS